MIKWIVASSILIVVMIALRYGLKGRISLRLQYALWGLVLLRLLIPFSIGSSSLSVMNTVQRAPVVQDAESISSVDRIEHMMDGSVEGYYPSDFMCDFPTVVAESKTAEEYARMEKVLSFREAFIPVWLCGAAVLFVAFAASNGRFASRLRGTRRPMDVKGSVLPVYITDETDTPCLFGTFRPAIYVTPEAAEDVTILRHTVEHETTHFRHGDNFWSVLRVVCLVLHWYNPLVWWAAILSWNDAELACDEGTINRIGEKERAEYGRTLIGMTCQKRTALLITATTMTGSRHSIKERITLIAKKPKMAIYTLVAAVLVAAVAVGCTFTGAEKDEKTTANPAALTDIFTTLTTEQTPVRLTLTVNGDKIAGEHNGWGCSNDVYLSNRFSDYAYKAASPNEMSAEDRKITLMSAAEGDDWSVNFYEGSDFIQLTTDGTTTCYQATPVYEDSYPVGTILRMWYDEAEFQDIGGSYAAQGQIVIPDEGQDYLTAAKEYCEAFQSVHLTATSGSTFCYTYVSCKTEAAEETTARFREMGEIDENTYAFFLTTVFVPENERARDWSMAGNTGEYTGTDPNVPEGAYEYYRCGYITLSDDGWHGNLVGTGF